MEKKYWFRSDQFQIQDGEDEATNPGCYGKSLAEWLSLEFANLGYATQVIPEDWGWCVVCVRDEFLLWIGCGCMTSGEALASTQQSPPDDSAIVWGVFIEIEVPFFKLKSLIRKWLGTLDLATPLHKLDQELQRVLAANESISFCPEP